MKQKITQIYTIILMPQFVRACLHYQNTRTTKEEKRKIFYSLKYYFINYYST